MAKLGRPKKIRTPEEAAAFLLQKKEKARANTKRWMAELRALAAKVNAEAAAERKAEKAALSEALLKHVEEQVQGPTDV